MESLSPKVAVVYQNERKLKQATLSFGKCVKFETKDMSKTIKKQKFNDESIEAKNGRDTSGINQMMGKQQLNGSSKLDECEVMEVEVIKDDSVREINSKVDDVSDVVEISNELVYPTVNNNENSVVILVDEINKNNKEDSAINKRKSECIDKGQKPPKRVKLIYHVDKVQSNGDSVSNDENPVTANCTNDDNGGEKSELDIKEEESKTTSGSNSDNDDVMVLTSDTDAKMNDSKSSCNANCSENEKVVVTLDNSRNINAEGCITPESKKNSVMGKSALKKMTPKQLEKMAKRKEERELLQQEKERKKKEKEEEKVRVKQEKEEMKKKLREEKEKKKQAEIELKNEEKRKKEEEKRKKEEQKLEDKRRKEEQKLEDKRKKEEEEELIKSRKSKEAEAFYGYFRKSDVARAPVVREDDKSCSEIVFMPFTVKADMRLAPVNRNPMDDERRATFEEFYNAQSEVTTYLLELRSGCVIPRKSGNTWPLEEKYDDNVVVLDEGLDLKNDVKTVPRKKFSNRRPKLLQFSENRRPPYWGTWRKKSKFIRPKNPFGKDEMFDYEVDSDDEWEEEEPGESLHGSDDEKESEDEYEVDNDFFVPHGYLSDDENPEEEIISPETQKAKLKLLGEQFDQERNEKTKLLKPITLGCIWFNNDTDEPTSANPSVVKFLNKRKAVLWTDTIPILLLQDENIDPNDGAISDQGTPTSTVKKANFPDAAIPDLIILMHGSTSSRKKLATTFLLQWNKKEEEGIGDGASANPQLSQARIARKIKELGKWEEFPEEGPCCGKYCWYVKKEIREKYGVADSVLTNKMADDSVAGVETDGGKRASPPLITKFTKVLTEDERMMALKANARKPHVATPKPLSESTVPNTATKMQLKCSMKLAEYWAKPSITSKYNVGRSTPCEATIPEADEDVEIVASPSVNRATSDDQPVAKKRVPILCSVPRGCNIVRPSQTVISTKPDQDVEMIDKSEVSESKGDAKKRVAILSSVPLGCEVVRPTATLSPANPGESVVMTSKDTATVSERRDDALETKPPKDYDAVKSAVTRADSGVVATADDKPAESESNDEASATRAVDSKPAAKKRVPLLSSGGPASSSRKLTLDKVIAKCEKVHEPIKSGDHCGS